MFVASELCCTNIRHQICECLYAATNTCPASYRSKVVELALTLTMLGNKRCFSALSRFFVEVCCAILSLSFSQLHISLNTGFWWSHAVVLTSGHPVLHDAKTTLEQAYVVFAVRALKHNLFLFSPFRGELVWWKKRSLFILTQSDFAAPLSRHETKAREANCSLLIEPKSVIVCMCIVESESFR